MSFVCTNKEIDEGHNRRHKNLQPLPLNGSGSTHADKKPADPINNIKQKSQFLFTKI